MDDMYSFYMYVNKQKTKENTQLVFELQLSFLAPQNLLFPSRWDKQAAGPCLFWDWLYTKNRTGY